MQKKNATQAGSGQGAKSDPSIIARNRRRLLGQPIIRQHLIPVGSEKRPLYSHWQQPNRLYGENLLLPAPAIGLRLGYPVLAVDFDPKPDNLGQAELTFQQLAVVSHHVDQQSSSLSRC